MLYGQIDAGDGVLILQPQMVMAVKIGMIMSFIVRERVFVFLQRVNVREGHTVVKVNLPDGGNNQSSRLRAFDGLGGIVSQPVSGVVDNELLVSVISRHSSKW